VINIDNVMLLNDNNGGKAEDIDLFIGTAPGSSVRQFHRRPADAGVDRRGERATLMMLVHHTDAEREYAYGPAGGLPNTGIGMFTDALLQEAIDSGLVRDDMKNDWKTIFGGEERPRALITAPFGAPAAC
jgi:hypothetical protein